MVSLVVSSALLAGCTDAKGPLEATAATGWTFVRGDYDYDGSAARPARGNLTMRLDAAKDEAVVRFDLFDGRADFVLEWIAVTGDKPWMAGGVAEALTLHGESGNGTAELPELFAYAAVWGTAKLRVLGAVERDPTTGQEQFSARAYIVRGHVRDRDSGAIRDDAGQAYNPNVPNRAAIDPEGAQVLIELRTATGSLWRHFSFDDVRLKGV